MMSARRILNSMLLLVVPLLASVAQAFAPPRYVPRATSRTTTTTSSLYMSSSPPKSEFLTPTLAKACVEAAGGTTPLYAYSLEKLEQFADACLAFPNAYGLTVRYAMKACPNAAILKFFSEKKGIHIDASSGYEVRRAMAAGIPASHISLSSQELPTDFVELMDMGLKVNACSLSQLERIGKAYNGQGQKIGIRINPGVGSGGFSGSTTSFSKTNVGGPSSSFGIWHTLVEKDVMDIVNKYGLIVERIHTHIGSGSDPEIWQQVATKSLSFCTLFDTVDTLNLGGGYKVGRNEGEVTTDLQAIGKPVAEAFKTFCLENNGRELQLEIEPGTYLVAMAGALVSTIQDKVETKDDGDSSTGGHVFLKLDAGMTDVLRPSLYGAIHPITILPMTEEDDDNEQQQEKVVVVGHCCESGDLMTPKPGEPEDLEERLLRKASIGDLLVMDGSGAYCSGMSTKNYNSFPEAPEVLVDTQQNKVHVIRQKQTLEQIIQNEVDIDVSVL